MPDKGQRAKATIVEAARTLFYHQGYGATSYADISDITCLGKGNIHYYFNSKDDILRAVTERRLEIYRKVLEEWSLDCGTPYDCLVRFIDMFADNAKNLSLYGCPIGTLNDELGIGEQHRYSAPIGRHAAADSPTRQYDQTESHRPSDNSDGRETGRVNDLLSQRQPTQHRIGRESGHRDSCGYDCLGTHHASST